MKEIISEGHAAILVSHGMPQIRQMSQLCMWLSHGQVRQFGPTNEVVSCYEREIMGHVGVQTGIAATRTTSLIPELAGRAAINNGGQDKYAGFFLFPKFGRRGPLASACRRWNGGLP